MVSLILFVGLASLATATPYFPREVTDATENSTTFTPVHYLSEDITNRTFYNNSCTAETVSIRKEWRSLTHSEKTDFLDAELCLMALPNRTALPGSFTRYEDFQVAHQQGTNGTGGDIIHYTGQFLAWHRAYLHLHELALKTECNFTGIIPWWDEATDVAQGDFYQSDMWDDQYFGGNGSSVDNCVTTGVVANRTMHIGPLKQTTDYCWTRDFNETIALTDGARSNVDDCYEIGGDEFYSYHQCMLLSPHIAGHSGTGGVINATDRLYAIGGNTTVNEPATGWELLTLDYEMDMYGAAENVAIGDVTNIQGGYLCYAFEY